MVFFVRIYVSTRSSAVLFMGKKVERRKRKTQYDLCSWLVSQSQVGEMESRQIRNKLYINIYIYIFFCGGKKRNAADMA